VDGALFVADKDMLDVAFVQFVVDVNDGPAGVAEDRIDPFLFEAPDENLCTF
jgi:hypothetical protein